MSVGNREVLLVKSEFFSSREINFLKPGGGGLQVKTAAEIDDPSVISGTHVLKGEN